MNPLRQEALLSLFFLGCGSPAKPALYPVAGKVLVGEKPVPSGMVQFRADAGRGNTTMEVPTGTIEPDGTFSLYTAGRPGAPAGWYRVLVLADNFATGDPPKSPEWPRLPKDYPKPFVSVRYLYFHETDVIVEVVPEPREDAYVLRLNP